MKQEQYDQYIKPLIVYYGNDPKYISNSKIEEYLTLTGLGKNKEAVFAIIELYSSLGLPRHILSSYTFVSFQGMAIPSKLF